MTVVQQDWDFGLSFDSPYLTEGLDLFESLNLSPLEELWKTDLENLSDAWNLQDDFSNLDCKRGSSMIRVHDCMWAGTCLSKDHVGSRKDSKCQQSCNLSQTLPTTSGSTNSSSSPIKIPQNKKSLLQPNVTVQQTPQRSLIRKPTIQAPQKVLHRPDTPQSEDDLSKTPDDHDLSWSRGVAVSEITGQRRTETTFIQTPTTIANNVSFDHNYNTKQKPRIDDGLGVVTPSDSAEEESGETEDECGTSEVENEEELEDEEEEEDDEDEEEEIDVVSLKPPSPPRKFRMQEQWRRQEELRMDEWRRQERLRQEQAVKFASQAVSKRLSAVSDYQTTRVNNRSRQKRKRQMLSDDEDSKIDLYVPNYRIKQTQKKNNSRRKTHNTPSKKTRISTDSETDCTEKRSQHNNMERKRRIDLRNAFEDLRSLVPSLADAQRAAKVTILKDAANYCSQLNSNAKTLQSQVAILRREQEKLRQNLSKLRKHIAHKHVGSNHR